MKHEGIDAEWKEVVRTSKSQTDAIMRQTDAIKQQTDAIVAELKEHRDERRALMEALFRVMDRLDQQPPPPPNLRSA